MGRESDPPATEIEVIRAAPTVQKTIATLKLKDAQGYPLTPEEFLSGLSLENIPSTDILEVVYQSPDLNKTTLAVNQLMSTYLKNRENKKTKS